MKKRIVTKRGTASKEIEIGPLAWSGKSFLEHQEKLLTSLPSGMIISLGKGTASMLASYYPKKGRKLPSGGTIVSARGTKIRYLK